MKQIAILLILLLLCSLVFALSPSRTPVENTYFANNLAVAARRDTLVYCYFDQYDITLCYSFDAGNTWQEAYEYYNYALSEPSLSLAENGVYIRLTDALFFFNFSDQQFSPWYYFDDLPDENPYLAVLGDTAYYFQMPKSYPLHLQMDFSYDGIENPFLVPPHYYSDTMKSPADNYIYFYGQTVMDCIVATNQDIAIKNYGGGDNYNWPLFQAPVICGGQVFAIPDPYPEHLIFTGGIYTNTPLIKYPRKINRESFDAVLGDEDKIVCIHMEGNTFSGYEGTLSAPRTVTKTVYSSYPPATDSLFTNTYTVRDTLWTPIESFDCAGKHILVNGALWIKGSFSGVQSWYCRGDIKLVGEITLTNTTPGQYPAASPLDMVNLISEGDVIVGYGYKSPTDSLRYHCFAGEDAEPMYIYANIYALGKENPQNLLSNGVFTFEYQHPHPSTPAILANMQTPDGHVELVLFDNIDIHRRHYPPTAANPWPSPALGQERLDLPYYNPIWPEARPYLERGTLHVYGNVYQKKRGFMHRSHNDGDYPSNSGVWDIEMDQCGHPTDSVQIPDPVFGNQLSLYAQNYIGAYGQGVGYKVKYFADKRYQEAALPDDIYNEIMGIGLKVDTVDTASLGNISQYENIIYAPNNEITLSKSAGQRGDTLVFGSNDAIFYLQTEGISKDLSPLVKGDGIILSTEIDTDGTLWILQSKREENCRFLRICQIDPAAETVLESQIFPAEYQQKPAALHISEGGRKFLGFYEDGFIVVWELLDNHDHRIIANIDVSECITDYSKLCLKTNAEDRLHLWFWENANGNPVTGSGNLHYYSLEIPVSNSEEVAPALTQSSLRAYPNPARNKVNLTLKLPQHQEHQIEIYNIRGQKVHSFRKDAVKGKNDYDYEWDIEGAKVPGGLYILRLKLDGKNVITKKVTVF